MDPTDPGPLDNSKNPSTSPRPTGPVSGPQIPPSDPRFPDVPGRNPAGPGSVATAQGPFSQYLISQLGSTAPGAAGFQSILDQGNQLYGFAQGQDGYALFYPGNNTIGLGDSYLTFENGAWKATPRGAHTAGATSTTTANPLLNELMSKYSGLIDKYSQPVDPNDPMIRSQVEAYHGTLGKSLQAYREQAAERAYAEGVPTGSFDASIGNAVLGAGKTEGDFESALIGKETQDRRTALQQVLGGSSSTGLGVLGLDQQNRQFYDDYVRLLAQGKLSQDDFLNNLLLN